jgi:hypothetical protein
MANPNQHGFVEDEKQNALQKEYTIDEEGKTVRAELDYSGAHEKTDPAEIKLVRKLDKWIMVSITNRSFLEQDN